MASNALGTIYEGTIRHLIRFNVRTLLAVVAIAAIASAWYGYRFRARAVIYSVGGTIDGRVVLLRHTSVSDDDLKHVKWVEPVDVLWLNDTNITDSGVKYIQSLHGIKVLFLDDTLISDAGVALLDRLPLRWLSLNRTQITDRAIPSLSRMKALECLDVSGTKITESGMLQLRSQLRRCNINSSGGVCCLEPLKK